MPETGPPSEPPAAGAGHAREYNLSSKIKIDMSQLDTAAGQVKNLTTQLNALKTALSGIGTQSGAGFNSLLGNISKQATDAAASVKALSSATGGGSGTSSGAVSMPSGTTGAATHSNAIASASSAQQSAASGGTVAGGSGAAPGGMNLSALMVGSNSGDMMKDIAMFPLRFMRDRIQTNRETALMSSGALGMQSFAQGGGQTANMMSTMAKSPGNIMGTPGELLNVFANAPGYGATYGFGTGQNGVRAAGYLKGINEAQMMNPGGDLSQMAGAIGGQASNTRSQQVSQMMTGGAFSMIKQGGGQKSVSEWANSILRWLEGLRPGAERGKGFTYIELMSQQFPGSNIDAWLDANGISGDMKEYFWTYSLAKSKANGNSKADGDFKIAADRKNVSQGRLESTTAMSKSEFNLAGKMSDSYANKEQANKWFNDLIGNLVAKIIPKATKTGPLSMVQYMPDTIEDMMMTALERSGSFGAIAGGILGYGGISGMFSGGGGDAGANRTGTNAEGHDEGIMNGDVGDLGVPGTRGATSAAGLHPDMRRKVEAMQAANPNIRVTSGLRDHTTQQRLRKAGNERVTGKPSAHTRGEAADLGPRSEYGWISANARKFGLKSGKSHGEPWHVGMGDVGDNPFSGVLDLFGGFKTMIGGDPMEGLAEMLPAILNLLTGSMGKDLGSAAESGAAFNPDMYSQLYNKNRNVTIGGITPSSSGGGLAGAGAILDPNRVQNTDNYSTGGLQQSGGVGSSGAGGKTLRDFFTQVLQGLGAPATPNNLNKLGAVAKLEGNGSNFNPFNSTGGDYPNKENVNPGVENYPDWATGLQYTKALLTNDRTTAAGMGANLKSDGSYSNWYAALDKFYNSWGGGNALRISETRASEVLGNNISGAVGDMPEYPTYGAAPVSPGGQSVSFQNTFVIQGGGSAANGGIDLRRTVGVLADHLESEMKQRMARTN